MERRPASGRAERERMRGALVGLRVRPGPLAREATDLLGATVAPAVAELEAWSARTNGSRPLPGLRRLFR